MNSLLLLLPVPGCIIIITRRNRNISRTRRIPSIRSQVPVLFSVRFPEKVSRCYAGNVHSGSQRCPEEQQHNSSIDPVHYLQHWRDVKRNSSCFALVTYGTFTLHGNRNGTCSWNGTGTIGDNGSGPVPGPGAV